jgi:2-polyprenyl-3-methyl-5-hydroxy-6-metoxy-1,4-benzoquinol methylase
MDNASIGVKTTAEHWNGQYDSIPSPRFWSPFDPTVSDVCRLLTKIVRPSSSFLEIGCAPGKYLGAISSKLGARVSGLDYSENGIEITRRFMASIGENADLRCEEMAKATFPTAAFDTVFSIGFIEHFDNPAPVVARHLEFVKPGGAAVMLVPNYGGWIGRIQGVLDPANLAILNIDMMRPAAMRALVDPDVATPQSFYFGRPSLWQLSLSKHMPAIAASALQRAGGLISNVFPSGIPRISPMIALIAKKH